MLRSHRPPIAQLVEQRPFKPQVLGSSPSGRTMGVSNPKTFPTKSEGSYVLG